MEKPLGSFTRKPSVNRLAVQGLLQSPLQGTNVDHYITRPVSPHKHAPVDHNHQMALLL